MDDTSDFVADAEMPRARLALLLEYFSRLDDDREPWRVMYPLSEVLLLLACATIASCDDFDDIAAWAKHHLDFLRRFALALVRADKTKGSVKTRRKSAGWNTDCLLTLLQLN